jgi:hypothetical protein
LELYPLIYFYSCIDFTPVGIKDEDHLVEINGKNVEKLSEGEIKKYIRTIKSSEPIQLLVVNNATYDYYKRRKERIHSGLPGVQIMPQGTANVFSLCMCCLFQFSFF